MDAKILGQNIRFFRKKIGLTQAELAHKINRSENIIPRWERGEIQPKAQNIPLLAKALGITSSQLLGENIEINKKTQSSELGLAYWGEVADNLRELINSRDEKKFSIVKSMLLDSLELEGTEQDKNLIKQENVGRDAIVNIEK